MRTFQDFLEQVESAQEKILADKKRSADYIKAQIRAGMRHRAHVHRELAHRQEIEKPHTM